MRLFDFGKKTEALPASNVAAVGALLDGYSIEVMPRTAEKVADFREHLAPGTRVYIAHIEGVPFDDMLSTAKRLVDEGFAPMPHFPARIIPSAAVFEDRVRAYADIGVNQALVLGGSPSSPAGDIDNSMQLLENGAFDRHGFKRLHVAGHPEGNSDIKGGEKTLIDALRWKQDFRNRSDAEMAIVTQFAFDAKPVLKWATMLKTNGIDLPVHIGIAGPAKLQTLIKFAMACGVGASTKVLTRRAKDLSKLLLPFEPTEVLQEVANHLQANDNTNIEKVHIFPLGGIKAACTYANSHK
ncbi:MAG TPA: methylenetetrahydrofolate reductase [Paracoccaceae bacterium]|nr:methylenetetrahydrofolate reductase [Paracoccaceae bacterium]